MRRPKGIATGRSASYKQKAARPAVHKAPQQAQSSPRPAKLPAKMSLEVTCAGSYIHRLCIPSGCWFPSCIYKQPLSLSSPALWLLQPRYELFMTLQALELETCELCFAAVQSLEAPLNVTTASSKSSHAASHRVSSCATLHLGPSVILRIHVLDR